MQLHSSTCRRQAIASAVGGGGVAGGGGGVEAAAAALRELLAHALPSFYVPSGNGLLPIHLAASSGAVWYV
jgi:hypothetical protein